MGYYIETPSNHGKAHFIVNVHGGEIVDQDSAEIAMSEPGRAVIVVVGNTFFEAAGFAYSRDEFAEFTDPTDARTKTFVVMDRAKAEKLTGFNEA